MSQHDLEVTNADANTGITYRAAINAALQALGTMQSGASAPSTTYAYMFWADTTTGFLKRRNSSNTAWIIIELLDKVRSSDPTVTAWGAAEEGVEWYNTTDHRKKMWNGTEVAILG